MVIIQTECGSNGSDISQARSPMPKAQARAYRRESPRRKREAGGGMRPVVYIMSAVLMVVLSFAYGVHFARNDRPGAQTVSQDPNMESTEGMEIETSASVGVQHIEESVLEDMDTVEEVDNQMIDSVAKIDADDAEKVNDEEVTSEKEEIEADSQTVGDEVREEDNQNNQNKVQPSSEEQDELANKAAIAESRSKLIFVSNLFVILCTITVTFFWGKRIFWQKKIEEVPARYEGDMEIPLGKQCLSKLSETSTGDSKSGSMIRTRAWVMDNETLSDTRSTPSGTRLGEGSEIDEFISGLDTSVSGKGNTRKLQEPLVEEVGLHDAGLQEKGRGIEDAEMLAVGKKGDCAGVDTESREETLEEEAQLVGDAYEELLEKQKKLERLEEENRNLMSQISGFHQGKNLAEKEKELDEIISKLESDIAAEMERYTQAARGRKDLQ